MTRDDGTIYDALVRRGVSRRAFLQFSTAMAAALALPASYAPRIAQAVGAAQRLPVIWLRGQDCGGEHEAFLRASDPTVVELLLDLLSIEYHETLMAPAGDAAERSLAAMRARTPNGYLVVVEGGDPDRRGGTYCLVGGRPFTRRRPRGRRRRARDDRGRLVRVRRRRAGGERGPDRRRGRRPVASERRPSSTCPAAR